MARDAAENRRRRHHAATLVFAPRDRVNSDGGRRLFLRLASQDTPLPQSPCFGHIGSYHTAFSLYSAIVLPKFGGSLSVFTKCQRLDLANRLSMPAKRARHSDAFPAELGANIRRYREERRLTQRDLCAVAHYDLAQLSAVERGRAVPRADALRRIADALDVSLDRLCGRRTVKAAATETESRSSRTPDQMLSAGSMAIVEELDDLRRRVERLEALSGSRARLRSRT